MSRSSLHIVVQTLSGEFELEQIPPAWDVRTLKKAAASQCGLPSAVINFLFDQQPLKDDDQLDAVFGVALDPLKLVMLISIEPLYSDIQPDREYATRLAALKALQLVADRDYDRIVAAVLSCITPGGDERLVLPALATLRIIVQRRDESAMNAIIACPGGHRKEVRFAKLEALALTAPIGADSAIKVPVHILDNIDAADEKVAALVCLQQIAGRGNQYVIAKVRQILERELVPDIWLAGIMCLSAVSEEDLPSPYNGIVECLNYENGDVKQFVLQFLMQRGGFFLNLNVRNDIMARTVTCLKSKDRDVRCVALEAIYQISEPGSNDEDVLTAVAACLENGADCEESQAAGRVLARLHSKEAWDKLAHAIFLQRPAKLPETDAYVRRAAYVAMLGMVSSWSNVPDTIFTSMKPLFKSREDGVDEVGDNEALHVRTMAGRTMLSTAKSEVDKIGDTAQELQEELARRCYVWPQQVTLFHGDRTLEPREPLSPILQLTQGAVELVLLLGELPEEEEMSSNELIDVIHLPALEIVSCAVRALSLSITAACSAAKLALNVLGWSSRPIKLLMLKTLVELAKFREHLCAREILSTVRPFIASGDAELCAHACQVFVAFAHKGGAEVASEVSEALSICKSEANVVLLARVLSQLVSPGPQAAEATTAFVKVLGECFGHSCKIAALQGLKAVTSCEASAAAENPEHYCMIRAVVLDHITHRNPAVAVAAANALEGMCLRGDEEALSALAALAREWDHAEVLSAYASVCHKGDETALQILLSRIRSAHWPVRQAALRALAKVTPRGCQEVSEFLQAFISQERNADVRQVAVEVLCSMTEPGDERVIKFLEEERDEQPFEVQMAMEDALEYLTVIAVQAEAVSAGPAMNAVRKLRESRSPSPRSGAEDSIVEYTQDASTTADEGCDHEDLDSPHVSEDPRDSSHLIAVQA